jgi:endoglucanase
MIKKNSSKVSIQAWNKYALVKRCCLMACILAFSFLAKAQGFLKANSKAIVDGSGNEIILRGVGLGGWMLQEPYMLQLGGIAANQRAIKAKIVDLIGKEKTDVFYNAWLANHCRKADVDSLAAWGFNSIRLPMHYNLFTLPIEEEPVAGQNTWLAKGFQLTDSLLSWCKADKIYLILDLHATPGGQGADIAISDRDTTKPSLWQSEANQQKIIALWKNLAERYAAEQWIGGYDLINETNWGFQNPADKNGCAETENGPLKKLLTDITSAILTKASFRCGTTTSWLVFTSTGTGTTSNRYKASWTCVRSTTCLFGVESLAKTRTPGSRRPLTCLKKTRLAGHGGH